MTVGCKNLFEGLDRTRLKAVYEAMRPAGEAVLLSLYRRCHVLLEQQGFTPTIKYRVKQFRPYYEKLCRKRGETGGVPAITDVLGLRIICPFLEDVEYVETLLTEHFQVVEIVRKAADHSFREFGYDSLHLLVRLDPEAVCGNLPGTEPVCEIQLRTILQDAWAEVEHELIYKSDISLPNDSIKRKMASLNATLTLSDLIFQEIRDYQKDLRERNRRRRQVMEGTTLAFPSITINSPSAMVSPAAAEKPVMMPPLRGSALEQAMVAALQAHSSGDMEQAVTLYSQILRMKLPVQVRSLVYNHRGMARFALAEYTLAVKDFTRCLELDENNFRGYNNRGLSRRVLGDHVASLADYERSLAIDDSQLEAYWGRAQTYFEMKLGTKVLADCEKALSLDPGHRGAQELLQHVRQTFF